MNPTAIDSRVAPLVAWFETLSPSTLDQLANHYALDARFKDPFNDVVGHAGIRAVLSHMFEQVDEPRFVVDSVAVNGDIAYLGWTMHYRARGQAQPQRILGCSRLRMDSRGMVSEHRDFWDPAEELYDRIPVLGWLLRVLRRRLAAPPG